MITKEKNAPDSAESGAFGVAGGIRYESNIPNTHETGVPQLRYSRLMQRVN